MARISELHYSNTVASNTGTSEFIEVALTADEAMDPSDFVVSYYHTDGNLILELALDDPRVTFAGVDPQTNEHIYIVDSADTGVDITDPDGNATNNASAFSLTQIDPAPNQVIDFYDIGGGVSEIEAQNGAAAGMTSENIDLGGVSPNAIGGSIQFNHPDPDNFVVDTLSPGDTGFCFAGGTKIMTCTGSVLVEELRVGDLVKTKESGFKPIEWIGSSKVTATGKLAPIVISKGTFGNSEDLVVSPEHRILISGWQAGVLFGQDRVLVAAKHLVDGDRIYIREGGMIDYYHIACDRHEILYANDVEAESFLPTPHSLSLLDEDARAEFLEIFPEFQTTYQENWKAQFKILRAAEARLLN